MTLYASLAAYLAWAAQVDARHAALRARGLVQCPKCCRWCVGLFRGLCGDCGLAVAQGVQAIKPVGRN